MEKRAELFSKKMSFVCEVKMKYVGEYPVSGTKQFHKYLRFQKKSNPN